MFHLKCPICGGLLNEFEDGTYEFYAVGCSQCEWQTFEYPSRIEAWSKAEQFITKFPPILRIHKGDKAMVYDRIFTVRKVNTDLATIYFEGIYSEPFYVYDIQKWPWELEQTKEEDK